MGESIVTPDTDACADCPAADCYGCTALVVEPPCVHEWRCPNCGATTRARMADRPDAPAEADLRVRIVGWLLNLTGRNLNPTAADLGWLGNEADDLLSLPALQRLVEQAAEAARLRTVVAGCRELIAFYDRHEYATLNVDDLREIVGTGGTDG